MGNWEQKTELYDAESWRDPVRTRGDLPDVADEGTCCYVQEESAIYAFRSGSWVLEVARKKSE